jgi:outer membrane protein assembly factor BamB
MGEKNNTGKWLMRAANLLIAGLFTACGGGSSPSSTPTSAGSAPIDRAPPTPPAPTAPSVSAQPGNVSVTVGSTASFTVVASGTSPLAYQWQKNGTVIAGATSSNYTTPALALADSGSTFSVVVSNSAGNATSNSAQLSVTQQPGNGSSPADVVTFKNDVSRSGQYLVEKTLTPANVNSTSFGLLRQLAVDAKVDAQPLYLSQLYIGATAHNTVFVATENGSVYAFDADSGTQLWHVSLVPAAEKPSGDFNCDQVTPSIGITSTPVIDRTAGTNGTLYVVAMSQETAASKYHQRLHALDVTTGAELLNGPVEITATFPNTGGTTSFDPGQYEERAALLLSNGKIYTTWTSHCDAPPYSGWLIAFDQKTLSRSAVLNVGPNSGVALTAVPAQSNTINSRYGPAIWMSGDGPAADAAGNVYFLTANGRFEMTLDANGFPNMGDYGNSFVKVGTSGGNLTVADYFTSFDAVYLSSQDLDLGSGGEMLLPDLTDSTGTVRHLIVGAGKDSKIYLVDRDNMGKFNATRNNIWQEVDNALGGQIRSTPAYFNGTLYYGVKQGYLKAFSVTNARLSTAATSQSSNVFGYPGASPSISANGTSNAIVWANDGNPFSPPPTPPTPSVLRAYDATNLANELYDSNQAPEARDQFGPTNKFMVPTVAGGKVFVGTTNSVGVFGLLH